MKKMSTMAVLSIGCLLTSIAFGDTLKVTTWNIEHLGTGGRGFGGGYGGGYLPKRTDADLERIGEFIRDELGSDLVALQEIAINASDRFRGPRCEELDKIVESMGDNWKYCLPPAKADHHEDKSMYVGYLWNSDKVRADRIFPMDVPDLDLAGKALFDRVPLVGCFTALKDGEPANDFVLVNVHLASGQGNDENHLIAMTLIEYRLTSQLRAMQVTESDRIILGDFNDNPYHPDAKRTDGLYEHMEAKGYTDFVGKDFHATRMDANLRSVIDRILVNSYASKHVQADRATIWLPGGGDRYVFAEWRQTYSDHFPVSILIEVKTGKDDSDWKW